jgi:Trehalose synthase, N-terminal domain
LAGRQAVAMIFMIANARPPCRWNPLPARPFYPRNADPIGSANRRGPSADGTESSNAVLMSEISAAIATSALGLNSLEDYEPLIGAAATQRILEKARRLRTLHAVYISSTFYGGGVTEILTPLTLMMNAMGIETGWRMIQERRPSSAAPRSSTIR